MKLVTNLSTLNFLQLFGLLANVMFAMLDSFRFCVKGCSGFAHHKVEYLLVDGPVEHISKFEFPSWKEVVVVG